MMIEIVHYLTPTGEDPFQSWLDELADFKARVAVLRRVDRVAAGNFGDHKFLRDGVSELRLDVGPGYRVYFEDTAPLSYCCFVEELNERRALT